MGISDKIKCMVYHNYNSVDGDVITLYIENQLESDIQIGGWVNLNNQYCSEILSLSGPSPHFCGTTVHSTSYPKTIIKAQNTFSSSNSLTHLCNFYREGVLPGLYQVNIQKGAFVFKPHENRDPEHDDILGHVSLACTTSFLVNHPENKILTGSLSISGCLDNDFV
jgi:hypothetical protein